MKLCYDCVLSTAASTGRAALGNHTGAGECERCGRSRVLYAYEEIGRSGPALFRLPVYHEDHPPGGEEIGRSGPALRVTGVIGKRRPTYVVGWVLLILAIAVALAFYLVSLQAKAEEKLTLEAWCERALFRLPVYHEDHPPGGVAGKTAEKEKQLRAIAAEVARVSRKAPMPPRKWAALLITLGYHESTYSLRIFAGNCKKHECDAGRARSAWQVHRSVFTEPYWDKLWGIQNVDSQVSAADAVLRRHLHTCGLSPEGIFTAYMGRQCGTGGKKVEERVATLGRVYR